MTVGIGASPVSLGSPAYGKTTQPSFPLGKPAYCGTTTSTPIKSAPEKMLDDYNAYKRGQAIDDATSAVGRGFKKLVAKTKASIKNLFSKIPK